MYNNHHNHWMILVLLMIFTVKYCIGDDVDDKKSSNNCRERQRLIGTDKSDQYKLVDARYGEQVEMECHFCNEEDDHAPKVWYRQDVLRRTAVIEVPLDMGTDVARNRVGVTPQHRLVIKNVTDGDEGVYYCHGTRGEQAQKKFNYLLDLVFASTNNTPVSGNLTQWVKYKEKHMALLNREMKVSQDKEVARLRDEYGIEVEVISEWESWGPCLSCNRPRGVRSRRAKCRLKPTGIKNLTSAAAQDSNVYFFTNVFELSCKSIVLNALIPSLSNRTRIIPEYVREEACVGKCNEEELAAIRGKRTLYKKRFVLAKHSHLALVCPESTLDNVITWRKDGLLIDAGSAYRALTENTEEPRISMDTFRTLYLHDVTHEEEGNYTCFLDDVMVEAVQIIVVSKSLALSRAFIRHMTYIGFIFLLSFICYCAGVSVVCTRRHTFVGYNSLPTAAG